MPEAERFFEDFVIGQTFHSGTFEVTTEGIKSFGAQFDPQPFHLDEGLAAGTLFRGLAASGWHTAAIVMRLIVQSDLKPAGGTIGAEGRGPVSPERRGTCCAWRARWWRSASRALVRLSGS